MAGPGRFWARSDRAVATVWDAAKIVFLGQVNNAWFHRFPVGQILRHPTTSIGEVVKTFRTKFWKFYRKGSFFPPKIHYQTDPLYGIVSIIAVRINSKSFSYAVRSVQETYLSIFSATSDVRYCVIKPIVRCSAGAAWRPIYGRKADWHRK